MADIKFDPAEINSNILKLIALNRTYPRSYSPEEFHDILASLDETANILGMELKNEYLGAISVARQIDSSIDLLRELKVDEQDTQKILSDISRESRELQFIHDTMIAENYNLKDEQAILHKIRKTSRDKIKRILSGGSPINEISMDLMGIPFGDLYNSIAPKDNAETLKAIIESEKQKREAELKNGKAA